MSSTTLTRATMFYLGASTAACGGESPQEAREVAIEVAPAPASPIALASEPARAEPTLDGPTLGEPTSPDTALDDTALDDTAAPGGAREANLEARAEVPRGGDSTEMPMVLAPATGYGGPPMYEPFEDTVVRVRGRAIVGAVEGPTGQGALDAAIVTRMLRARLAAVRTCYERELRSDPTLRGRVSFELTIDPSGTAHPTIGEDTVGSPNVTACVQRITRSFRFSPGPEGGAATFRGSYEFVPES